MIPDTITNQALSLPADERAELAEQLWQSVRRREKDVKLTQAQREDLARRVAEDDAGNSDPQDWGEFLASLRRRKAS